VKPRSVSKGNLTKKEARSALRKARENAAKVPQASKAWFDAESQTVFVKLENANHGIVGLPREAFGFLANVSDADVADIEAGTFDVNWPKFDEGACLWWFIEEALGGHAALQSFAAFIRGTSRSPKKVAAARRNGRKGGRPRKKAA
jgi:hypothetical protein